MAERSKNVPCVIDVEQVDECAVLPFHEPNLQVFHESTDRQPEIISHRDDALYFPAVAMPQGVD